MTNRRDISPLIVEAESLFKERNQDKRIHDDGFEIDGSGWKPVKWDFRLASLLRVHSARA
ncbi:MAG TPA: hypothetical protein VMP01_28080 [Pirellulaceae bacterium]|nr:hypothetical protein [Pirellulaceae bacterium]